MTGAMAHGDQAALPEGKPILVVGDLMLDRFWAGAARRLSPEAPVPVVNLRDEWDSPGGAGNVAASLAALDAEVTCAGVVGRDDEAADLRRSLERMGVRLLLADSPELRTVTKTRVLASPQQQLVRIDRDGDPAMAERCAIEHLPLFLAAVGKSKAICLADYAKGTLPLQVIRSLIDESRRCKIPCIVDPKKTDFSAYAGATVLTPNLHETERALGRQLSSEAEIKEAATRFREELNLDHMLITRSADGMTLASADGIHHFPALIRQVADVTGAGDTVVAVLALCLADGWAMQDACRLASIAAGIAVSRPGVYVVRRTELERAWGRTSPKVVDPETARHRLRLERQSGRTIVFTNGCFDILHAGHLYCLQEARRHGDLLVIGLNSDVSVKLNKGPSRPINHESNRAALLAGLECVDVVVLFDELTPEKLVHYLEPDVMVKGGDYQVEQIAGADFVQQRGGRIVTIPLMPGLSTTSILSSRKGGKNEGGEA